MRTGPTNLDLAQQYNDALEKLNKFTDGLIRKYQDRLFSEEYDVDRLMVLEDIGQVAAAGSIILTNRIAQPVLITGFLASAQANQPAFIDVDRFTIPITTTQNRVQVIAPVSYLLGPGQKLQLRWTGASDSIANYFAAFGKMIGSHYT